MGESPAKVFIQYEHVYGDNNSAVVWVQEHLRGKHRDHCLCYSCALFKPGNRAENCKLANLLFDFAVEYDMVTPVWECKAFQEAVADCVGTEHVDPDA